MSKATHGVHRCPSCDQLTEAEYGSGGTITCLSCGQVTERTVPAARRRQSYGLDVGGGSLVQRNVVGRRNAPEVVRPQKTVLPAPQVPSVDAEAEGEISYQRHQDVVSDDGDKKVVRRRKRKRRFPLRRVVFVIAWFASIFLILALVKEQMKDSRVETPEGVKGTPVTDLKIEEQRRAEAEGYAKKSLPACHKALMGFYAAPDAAARAQFVRAGSQLAPKMADFYKQNTAFRPEGKWTPTEVNLVLHKDLRAIESVWRSEESGSREVAFVRDEGIWKLDWEFSVRNSSSPWHLFLSAVGPTQGTFRVFLRVKESTYSDDGDQVLNLRLYPPLREQLLRNRGSSPAVLVPIESESGIRIRQVLEYKEQKPLAGERRLFLEDPSNLHRVRVVLEWRKGTDGRRYLHLNKVLAGNWLGEGFEEDFSSEKEGVDEEDGPEAE